MSESGNTTNEDTRYAVVTGANKGIGLGICKQLAAKEGIVVVLTARDENRGIEALEKLKKENGFSDDKVLFHKLDVADTSSVDSLAKFIDSKFGKLDILVNNAGISGNISKASESTDILKHSTQNLESAIECIEINYYGAKRMIEAFLPLLQKSKSPRIVNVSSSFGLFKYVPDGKAKQVLADVDTLTEEKIDQVIDVFLKDVKEDSVKGFEYPSWSAYTISKACVNAYTRILATKYQNIKVNALCPGYVKTDINYQTGVLTPEEAAAVPVRLALLPDDGPSGSFFLGGEASSF